MKKDKIIVSSSDSKYYELVKELFLSLRTHKLLDEYEFGILDTGMDENQVSYFKDNNVKIEKAVWNVDVPKYKILGRDHLKTQVARAFIPEYFPNYKIYIWLDADLWINDYDSFKLYEKGAMQNCIAIAPQSDRAYFKNANVEWFMNFPIKVKTINFKNIGKSISKKLARKYAFYSTLNAGAFAINSNIDLWNCFQKNIKLAAKRGRIFGTDQVALALTIYEDKTPTQFLPSYCNWMCDFHLPLYDEIAKKFVEPFLPYNPLAIVHLAGMDEIRSNKNIKIYINTRSGKKIKKSLRFNV